MHALKAAIGVDAVTTADRIARAVARLDGSALTEEAVRVHIAPLFSRVLAAAGGRIHLANHSLGRPLDALEDDVREALGAWYDHGNQAWAAWSAEIAAFRSRLAMLMGGVRTDAIIPKTSAGQGLRAVLNSASGTRPWRVLATRGEFDSIDVILREYASRGRIAMTWIAPDARGYFRAERMVDALVPGVDLVVVSPVMFGSGQIVAGMAELIAKAHAVGARVLLDVYHMLGVLPLDLNALDADFAVGGSYKYLRGGTGACFLYVHPRLLDGALRTLDIGWFAKETPSADARPDPPRYAPGGDAWLESTPAVLPFYQARSGQVFTAAMGVARLRAYSLGLQQCLVELLRRHGIGARGGTPDYGAFVTVHDPRARRWAAALQDQGVTTDARGDWLRLGPDLLTTRAELERAAECLGQIASATG